MLVRYSTWHVPDRPECARTLAITIIRCVPTMTACFRGKFGVRRGVVAVEAAIVLPVLLIFAVAVIDVGRFGRIADSLSNAARNGAQYAMVNTSSATDTTGIRNAVMTEMSYLPNTSSTNPNVSAAVVTVSGTKFVQVSVTYNMSGTNYFNLFPLSSMTRTVQMPMMPQ